MEPYPGATKLKDTLAGTLRSWNDFSGRRAGLLCAFPGWGAETDARITVFAQCANVLEGAILSLIQADQYLSKPESLSKAFAGTQVSPEDRQKIIDSSASLMRMSVLHFGFSAVESALRLFLRAIDLTACSGATAEASSVYTCLLTRLNLRSWESLLDLWRLLRNTMHTNGIYLPRSQSGARLTLDGIEYVFIVGQPARAGWDALLQIYEHAPAMLSEIVQHPLISAIDAIPDPSAVAWAVSKAKYG